jgi:hypothetical protein
MYFVDALAVEDFCNYKHYYLIYYITVFRLKRLTTWVAMRCYFYHIVTMRL